MKSERKFDPTGGGGSGGWMLKHDLSNVLGLNPWVQISQWDTILGQLVHLP